ncbi:GAF domain-containing protein [Streptomyces sp. NPDC058953]|uniref:GAF domain-containing protein n=1 Tax=unclassified Streptomyces TaxID=2593676 RepID=UPI00369A4859
MDDGAPPLHVLLEAVLGLGTDLELPATLQHIVDTAAALTGARYGALGVIDPERGTLSDLFTCGMSDEERHRIGRLPTGDAGIVGLLIRDPRPLLIDDLTQDPRSSGVPDAHPVMRSFVGVPIRVHTEVFGNLYLTEKHGGPFTEGDLALLRMLASQAGTAIGNARLYETARQRERWIEGAAAVTTALLTGSSAQDALMTVAERARILAGAAAGVVLQPTADGGMEIVAASTDADTGGPFTDTDDGDRGTGTDRDRDHDRDGDRDTGSSDDIVGTTIAPGSPVLVQLLGGEPVFVEDSATDPRMTTHVRTRFGPSMMLPLQSGGRLIGTLALPRSRDGRPYSALERLLASQFASQAALALVLADAQHNRERLAVFEDRDRIARDLHDLVVQRLFATEMMLESARRRALPEASEAAELIGRAVDELDSTIQEVRTTIFALQQPPADAPTGFRGRVLRETAGAAALLGFPPSVHFRGPVDALIRPPADERLIAALRSALAAAHRRPGVGAVEVVVDATVLLGDGAPGIRLTVGDDGAPEPGAGPEAGSARGRTTVWEAPR